MSEQSEKLKRSVAAGYGSMDNLTDDEGDAFVARVRELLDFPAERDVEIWGTMADLTPDKLATIPPRARDLRWQLMAASLWAFAKGQAWVELFGTKAIESAAKHAKRQTETAAKMSESELKTAAIEGVGKDNYDGERNSKKSKA